MSLDERAWWSFPLSNPPVGTPWLSPMFVTDDGCVAQEDLLAERFCGTTDEALAEAEERERRLRWRGHYAGGVTLKRIEGAVAPPASDADVLAEVRRILRTPEGLNIVEHALALRRLADLGDLVLALVDAHKAGGGS